MERSRNTNRLHPSKPSFFNTRHSPIHNHRHENIPNDMPGTINHNNITRNKRIHEKQMKTKKEIEDILFNSTYKDVEKALDIKIRNGQAMEGIRKALKWVIN